MNAPSLMILWLWPDILNLHGDRGNIAAVKRLAKTFGIKTEVRRVTRLSDTIDFSPADLIFLGPGELASMPFIIGALEKHRGTLEARVNSGGTLFCTGTTGAALSRKIHRANGETFHGLGLLSMDCEERTVIHGDDLIYEIGDERVFGVQIRTVDFLLDRNQEPLGKLVYGLDNSGRVRTEMDNVSHGFEGAVKKGFLFTNALGPVLVKNPRIAVKLIRDALSQKAPEYANDDANFALPKDMFLLEDESARAVTRFNKTKQQPKTE